MIELPEALTLAHQMNDALRGKTIKRVVAAQSPHGFAFYHGDPADYPAALEGKTVLDCAAFGGIVALRLDGMRLTLNDGAYPLFTRRVEDARKNHQLLLEFDDGSALSVAVQMYGGIQALTDDEADSWYHAVAQEKPSPLSEDFTLDYFLSLRASCADKLSAKAFLATEQRIPGLGNGVLQDILFNARIHPKCHIGTLSGAQLKELHQYIVSTLSDMTAGGGRDTERNLFGEFGGYHTLLSKKMLASPCPVCGGALVRAAYLGGNIYFCPHCQPL